MAHQASLTENVTVAPGSWSRARMLFLVMAVVGLGLSALGFFTDKAQFSHSYLTGFMFTLSIALGCLFFVLVKHLARAGWNVVTRRIAEVAAVCIPVMGILFIPVLLGNHELFHWTHHDAVEHDALLQHKEGYLNLGFFIARAVGYFLIWSLSAIWFYRKSVEQDESHDPHVTVGLQRRAAPLMILFALSLTFMAFDWLMSLDPHWFSTIFGVYMFAGCALCAFAFVTLAAMTLRRNGQLEGTIRVDHYQDLGRLMFAFTVFWAYIGFSQFFLIWYGNVPEETLWFLHRAEGSWKNWSALLGVGRFLVPFALLMSRYVKRRPVMVAAIAVWVLCMHYVDMYWLVMPNLHHDGVHLHWMDLTCVMGTLGVFLSVFVRRFAAKALVPVGDPRLKESLALHHAY